MPAESKLTNEVHQSIVDLLRAGNYLETAARCNDLPVQTVRVWIRKGEKESSGRYHDFARDVRKASAQAEAKYLRVIEAACEREWQPAAWILERRNPKCWGKRSALRIEREQTMQTLAESMRDHMPRESYKHFLQAIEKLQEDEPARDDFDAEAQRTEH